MIEFDRKGQGIIIGRQSADGVIDVVGPIVVPLDTQPEFVFWEFVREYAYVFSWPLIYPVPY
jgi:hypothetical protein